LPKITPFRGLRYNADKVGDLSKVVAPPYDVIPPKMQESLYKAHPSNIVRLILNKIESSDTAGDNRYTRAGKCFESWIAGKIFVQDKSPAIYIYSQTYKYGNKTIERPGFISLMAIDTPKGEKGVLPHENTLKAPKVDRLSLMREVKANLSPIFVLYDDKAHAIRKILLKFCSRNKPVADIKFENVRNRLWRMDSPAFIKSVEDVMAGKEIFIADGHHRFEVAKMFHGEMLGANVSEKLKRSSGYIMVYFAESGEDILTILPAHRLVRDLGTLPEDAVLPRLEKFFSISKMKSQNMMMRKLSSQASSHVFGMYDGSDFYVLKLKDPRQSDKVMKDKSRNWKRLDVSILHLFIFQHVLGVRDDDDNIEFMKDPGETARSVDKGEARIAFFLNPTKVAQVKNVAKLGERMPRKATYFYPKPVSGLVINKF